MRQMSLAGQETLALRKHTGRNLIWLIQTEVFRRAQHHRRSQT